MIFTKPELTTILQTIENEIEHTFSDEQDKETIKWRNHLEKLKEKVISA